MKKLLLQLLSKSTGKILFIVILVLSVVNSYAVTKTAISSGNYTTAAIWSPAGKPNSGDNVIIPVTRTVTVSVDEIYPDASAAMQFTVSGTLFFAQSMRLFLPCNSLVNVLPGGLVDGEGDNNSQRMNICNVEVWKGKDNGAGPLVFGLTLLPVELIEFSSTCILNGVQLNWTTATELNNQYFLIEKSTNATEWDQVSKIIGHGTSNSTNKYIHTDTESSSEMVYYRLSQVDIDGNTTIFKTIDVKCDKNIPDQMILFPNPASTEINIILNINNPVANGTIKLINNIGVIVLDTKVDLNNGINSFIFPIDADAGSYHILFSSDDVAISSQKLLIFKP